MMLSEAIKYGYLTNFKIENMHEQFLARQKQGKSLEKQGALRVDGGLLGAALCAAQRVHLSLPPCDVPCAGQYPRPAAGRCV